MSDDLDNILKEYGQQMVDATAEIIVQDTRGMIQDSEALVSPNEEGSGIEPVRELAPLTIKRKTKLGFEFPGLARYRTGAMLASIKAEYGDLTDTVRSGAEYSSEQQEGTTYFGNPVPPRPFFGVSDRALKQATAECQKIAEQFIAATNGRTIQGEITVSV